MSSHVRVDAIRGPPHLKQGGGFRIYRSEAVQTSPFGSMQQASTEAVRRRFPIGAEITGAGTHFRVWAPGAESINVVLEHTADRYSLIGERDGYFSGLVGAPAGSLYRFSINGGDSFPDPASRYQPEGPSSWSEVIDPAFAWTDRDWPGVKIQGAVFYELHVGTFTRAGTWQAASAQLPELASIGIRVIELMPVADFAGRWGWGYDGVNFFAPSRLYGTPEDFRKFVDQAHALGLGVILDVVYNHLGPVDNYLPRFSPYYFHRNRATEWGDSINYDGEGSHGVREFVQANAAYWIEEFHLDGLRLDATQSIHDTTHPSILEEIGQAVRGRARGRDTIVLAENEKQHSRLVRSLARGGDGLDGLWNDDFHHSARVALTGKREAYYTDYTGRAQELLSAMKYGYLFQGQRYSWQNKGRGSPSLDVPRHAFVTYLQNHDQIANSAHGSRLHKLTSPGQLRAMTVLLLLGPGTPLLFQGQEFHADAPFLYFADHNEELAPQVAKGRAEFLSQFPSIEALDREALDAPHDRATFERCKLDFADRRRNAPAYLLHKDLLRLRREDAVFTTDLVDGFVFSDDGFALRYFSPDGDERLLLVNLGADFEPRSISEPLIAPPEDRDWRLILSSEDRRYGGGGVYEPCTGGWWRIPGRTALVMAAVPR